MERFIQSMVQANPEQPLAEVKIRYGMALLRNEFFKLLILFLFYLCVGRSAAFLLLIGILFPVRIYSGGLHMKTNLTCFAFSFGFTFSIIFLLPNLSLPSFGNLAVCCGTLVMLSVFSPFSSPKKPIASRQRFVFFKKMSVLFTVTGMGVVFLLYHYGEIYMAQIGQWTLFLQAIQLLLAHILRKGAQLCSKK
ncbi:MAG: accessory gene regulator B family protein [Clostridiales Family XIII bacterium]|nr:accessory gene regulator B family protein [Clostridiales Family XIII bacterium]